MKLPKFVPIAVAPLALIAGCGLVHSHSDPPAAKPAVTHTVIIHDKTKVIHKTKIVQVPAAAAPAAPAAPPQTFANAEAVVDQYYQDITNQDYSDAWALGGDNIGGTNYDAWVAGYDTTASITISTASEFNSTTVQADIVATQDDGSVNTYSGTYTVNSGVITAASIAQTS